MEMFVSSGNKMLSIEFLMLLILLLVIKTINASTIPSSALNELSHVKSNKCEQISITQHCPELKYNQTMISTAAHLDINDSIEMVSFMRITRLKSAQSQSYLLIRRAACSSVGNNQSKKSRQSIR